MKIALRYVVAVALVSAWLMSGARAVDGQTVTGFVKGPQASVGEGNLTRVRQLLADTPNGHAALDDYYFVAVGDIQNTVRSFGHQVFDAIAKDVQSAVDERTGAPVYDKVRFVILLGDMVYQGSVVQQWENLEGSLAGRGLDGASYPHIARLVSDKPILPLIGNHELLEFHLRPQTKHRDLFDSPEGVANFKRFFGWDRFIANPKILYPVPTDLSAETYRAIEEKNPDPEARRVLASSYTRGSEGRYRLAFFDNPPLQEAEFAAGKAQLADRLVPLFRRAGYGTLPVINSDNMIAYGVDAGNTIFLFLDSMARGWHYPGLARLKQALYPNAKDQHRLNLFSESPFNGQADFYRAVAAYAHETGKSIVPMMHHSVINGSKSIHATGLGYNFWLALGLPQTAAEHGDATLYDEILFSDASYGFSGCVHGFENFSLVASSPGRPDHTLRWFVAGGGGGPLTKDFSPARLKDIETRYNQKHASTPSPAPAGTIAIVDDTWRLSHHYLLVHVQGGRIVDVSPRFIDMTTLARTQAGPQLTMKTGYYSRTSSAGAAVEFTPRTWGLERVRGFLAFVNWRPSVSLGMLGEDDRSNSRSHGTVFEMSPSTLDVYIPGPKILTLRPLGFEMWAWGGGRRDYFLTTGVELPVFYDAWGRLPNLTVGLKAYIPVHSDASGAANLSQRAGIGISVGYRVKR